MRLGFAGSVLGVPVDPTGAARIARMSIARETNHEYSQLAFARAAAVAVKQRNEAVRVGTSFAGPSHVRSNRGQDSGAAVSDGHRSLRWRGEGRIRPCTRTHGGEHAGHAVGSGGGAAYRVDDLTFAFASLTVSGALTGCATAGWAISPEA